MPLNLQTLVKYFFTLTVSFHDTTSLFGFFILLTVFSQLFSGTMISFSLIPEPMMVPIVRDEEDLEDLYTDDFFWLHERGVDLLFIFSWLHLFRKLYLNAFDYEHEIAWKSGVFTFLILQVVTFFGLVLCCTHLSEITLTIAANIMHTFFLFHGKFYWWIFTDKTLNSDTMIRLAYAHYVSAFYMAYLGVLHSVDMHYDWKNESSYDSVEAEMVWWEEALSNELGTYIEAIIILNVICTYLYPEPESLSYEIFMWGDIGLVPDVRFYGVAPHWYFRPFMGWLIVCPHHKTGIFGLIYFFFILFHQPTLHGVSESGNYNRKKLLLNSFFLEKKNFFKNSSINIELNVFFQTTYALFVMSAFYTSSFLPYGRFYNRLGGNSGMLASYLYVLAYLTFSFLRRSSWLDIFIMRLLMVAKRLKRRKKKADEFELLKTIIIDYPTEVLKDMKKKKKSKKNAEERASFRSNLWTLRKKIWSWKGKVNIFERFL
jgi:quinol-cytochrome oxidoreductase complex cytochrome b subunit